MRKRLAAVVAVAAVAAIVAVVAQLRRTRHARRVDTTTTRHLQALSPGAALKRPNLLLVIYDARRRDDFSFGPFGNERGDTPFLARLAGEALFLPNAVAPGCWTVPVHASIFTGRTVCELGNDYLAPAAQTFPDVSLALAERLSLAGYETVAWADHPFFYMGDVAHSLVRGFESFDVVNDFVEFPSHTNVGTPGGQVELRPMAGERRELPAAEFAERVRQFNAGVLDIEPARDADLDPVSGVYLARLGPMFERATYFERRYRALDGLFQDRTRPFFLFLNLHMSLYGEPDPELYTRWLLETLLFNAQAKGLRLDPGQHGDATVDLLVKNLQLAQLGHAPLPDAGIYLRHVFDNRFYDASFEAMWSYLGERGLLRDTVTLVTSDHGMSFAEHPAPLFLHGGSPPFEYITQVPLVVRFPEGSPLSRLHGPREEQVSLIDLYPTLLELAGEAVPRQTRPVSLLERIERSRFDPVMVSECSLTGAVWGVSGYAKSIRVGELKLIRARELYQIPGGAWPINVRLDAPGSPHRPLGRPLDLLFDLARDPHEAHNLAAVRPADVAAFASRSENWECRALAATTAPRPDWNPAALDTLRALGYVGVEAEP